METNKKKIIRWALPLLAAFLVLGAIGLFLYLNTPTAITVLSMPDRTIYDYGSALDTTGLTLELTRRNGKTEILTEGFTCAPAELTVSGSVEITANYRGKSTTFSVESTPVLTGIQVASGPDTTWYAANTTLDTAGLTLEASYTDGSTEIISEGFTCSPETLTQPGDQEITVTCQDQTTSFFVEVVGVSRISVRAKSTRNIYLVGQTPDASGAVLDVTYTDGSTDTIREGYTCSGDAFTEPGTAAYTISYGGADCAYEVEVLPPVEFDEFMFRGTGIYTDLGTGMNQDGEILTWALYIEFDYPEEAMDVIIPEVACSWADEIKDTLSFEACFNAAKKGDTSMEFTSFPAEYTHNGKHRLDIFLYLPDDPTIAGEQFVTIRIGQSLQTVYFTLEYLGDYDTGSGWRVYNIRY